MEQGGVNQETYIAMLEQSVTELTRQVLDLEGRVQRIGKESQERRMEEEPMTPVRKDFS